LFDAPSSAPSTPIMHFHGRDQSEFRLPSICGAMLLYRSHCGAII
jgi:hypothetical protein